MHLDCATCIVRQAVEAPRRFTDDAAVHERILRDTLAALSTFDFERPPPEMGAELSRIICRVLGDADPYLEEKRRFNALALEALPLLRERAGRAEDPFEAAVRLAVAANYIDFGAPAGRTDGLLHDLFVEAFDTPLFGGREALHELKERAAAAGSILYLADNAGEIVVDTLLVEQLPAGKVTVAVRGGPVINDALLEDAEAAGLFERASIITSGMALPGTSLAHCSDEFRTKWQAAELIISKGQGNFETLSDEPGPVFFLFVAKCPTVARHLGCRVGDYVVARSARDE